ncbi:TPA: hypothetical protein ACQYF6_000089 [Vibrio parahaemolyticus]
MTKNIEERTLAATSTMEVSAKTFDELAHADKVVHTPVGTRRSMPLLSREFQQDNQRREVEYQASERVRQDEFQGRFALSQQAIAWEAGLTVSDSLQRYSVGLVGTDSYKEFLPAPTKLPFETGVSFDDDLVNGYWLENGVPNLDRVQKIADQQAVMMTLKSAFLRGRVADFNAGGLTILNENAIQVMDYPKAGDLRFFEFRTQPQVGSKCVSLDMNQLKAQFSDGTNTYLLPLNAVKTEYSFSEFGGLCNGIDPDDDALDAAINSLPPGYTLSFAGMGTGEGEGLVLTRHHVYDRGDIKIKFDNIPRYWRAPTGYEPDRTTNIVNNPRSPGHLCFRGEMTNEVYEQVLTEDLPEFSEVFPVPGVSDRFTRGSWWIVTTDIAPGTTVGREINYLIEAQGHYGNPNQVRLNYRTGWKLLAGRKITYRKVKPVENIKLLDVGDCYYEQEITDGEGSGDEFKSQQATSLISFEIAHKYEITGLRGLDIPFVAIFEQWVNRGKESDCSTDLPLHNRSDQVIGRNGALYCEAKEIFNKSGRHVTDHTSSAYCLVKNSRETGTKNGAFTHHGSFEHDIYYEHTGGVMSIANSGPDYGQSAKRISVKNHNGTQLISSQKVSECTFEDCVFSEFAEVNADGNTLRNVDVPNVDPSKKGGLAFTQASNRTGKTTKIVGGKVKLAITSDCVPATVEGNITFDGTTIDDFRARKLKGSGLLSFINVNADGGIRGVNTLEQKRVIISGGEWESVPFRTGGSHSQYISLDAGYKAVGLGDAFDNKVWMFDKDSGGDIEINIGTVSFETEDPTVRHIDLSAASGPIRYKCVGAAFRGGELSFQTAFPDGSYLYHKANVEQGVFRLNVPTEAENIQHSDNMMI